MRSEGQNKKNGVKKTERIKNQRLTEISEYATIDKLYHKEGKRIVKFSELLEVTKDIDLEALGVSLGKAANRGEMISCFVDGDEWVMQEVDDRQCVFEKRGKEEDIVRKVYGNIKLRIRQQK